MSSRSRVPPVWLALVAAFTMFASADPDDASAPRFVPVEVYLESPEPVAAWQFEFADRAGAMKVVGIERGGHDAFPRAPYYDRDALASGTAPRIVVADYSLVLEAALPRGRFRLATLHLMLEGEPDFELRLVTATTPGGVPIAASIALGDSPTEPRETEP
ncbi:MAG: hypothetical protein OXM56_02460 [Gammaproteobacteria bacterium]|nr:hypothetical protein [Gammaproteobacteria bacterium]